MTNSIPWTPQQQAFFDRLRSSDDSIMLCAVAGSGKTTTLVEGVRHLRGTVLAVAFNVRIKKTLESQLSDKATCKTLNGLGHGALARLLNRRVRIDAGKLRKIARDLTKTEEFQAYWPKSSAAQQLVARAKSHGLVPSKLLNAPPAKGLVPDTEEEWEALASHYDIAFEPNTLTLARRILQESIKQSFKGTCDFDDQLYLPVCWGAPFDKFDNIVVDESQDLSEIQHKMLRKALKLGGRLIAVGDENQAIYGWRGSKSDSIEQLRKAFGLHDMQLTVSFRCAKRIVAKAQEVVSHIEPSPSAPEGLVTTIDGWTVDSLVDGDCILCRNNAPLIATAYRLIGEGKGVHMLGRDIGAGLKHLINRLVGKDHQASLSELSEALEIWYETEEENARQRDQLDRLQGIEDKYQSLLAVIDFSGATNIPDLVESIDTLFSKESAPITLSSIHRAKGLEWPRVFFLNRSLIPSRWSTQAYARDKEKYAWMMQEEANILYVGITRAQNELYFAESTQLKRKFD